MKILSPERQALLAMRLSSRGKGSPIAHAITRLPRNKEGDFFPLSFAQQRLWLLDQLEPGCPIYNSKSVLNLKGPLQIEAMSQSLREIINRHESLRTTFTMIDEQPVQVINSTWISNLSLVDLSQLVEAERARAIRCLIAEEAKRPFDLRSGPLLRATLLHLSSEDNILLIMAHYIVGDGWSIGIFIEEMTVLYRAFRSGRPSPLPELPIQYTDFAVWQRQWLQNEAPESQLGYWRAQLDGAPILEMPTDRSRPLQQDYAGDAVRVELEEGLTRELKALSRRHRTTLYMTLLAGWAALLGRLSGQEEVVIGTPVANRMRMEIEPLIGFFVNTLALRIDLSGRPRVGELLERVKVRTLEGQQNQDIPFEQVVEIVQPMRSLSHAPIFQAMFVLQNMPEGRLDLPGLRIRLMESPSVTAKFDLTLSLQEIGQGIAGGLEYATALYDRETVVRWLGYWRRLLQGMAAEEEQVIDRLPLLGEAERRQLLEEWNETEMEYPKEKCLHELFEEQVERSLEAVAVVYEGEQVSYGELNARANRLAHLLIAQGIGPEDVVALALPRSVEMIVALLGILKAGAAYLPIDPNYPAERMTLMLQDAHPASIITIGEISLRLPDTSRNILLDQPDFARALERSVTSNPVDLERLRPLRPDNPAYVIYTSGSTGRPKGVVIEHQAIVNRLEWMRAHYGIAPDDRILHKTPVGFDVSVWELFLPPIAGATLIVAPPDSHKDPAWLASIVRECRITTIHFVPSMLASFVAESITVGLTLRRVFCSGEELSAQLRDRFHDVVHSELHNLYGPTEAAVDVTYWVASPEDNSVPVPIGYPVWNTRIYVLDDQLQPVPQGACGNLYLGGVQLARGYLKQPALTAERFVADPYGEPGGRIYRTGDLTRWRRDGSLEFLGRADQQVKIRGFRIEPGEIEAALRELPEVAHAAVIVREDRQGEKLLVGYVVPTPGNSIDPGSIRRQLAQRLPDYMVPAAIVELEALPLTPNGKLDRKALPDPQWQSRSYHPPRTPQEEILCSLFAEVLGLERVGIDDNFFDLGGHSLLATRLVSQVRVILNVELAIRTLFESPTVASLSPRLKKSDKERPELLPQQRPERIPLSFAQQRLWFLDRLGGTSAEYNLPSALRLIGELDRMALEKAINAIVSRHESLRTHFLEIDGEPAQVILPELHIELPLEDLSSLDEIAQRDHILSALREEADSPFDLARGPLLRIGLLKLGEHDHILLRTMHHIVSDGWSEGVFNHEFALLYQAFHEGRDNPLHLLPIQYADFALWQRQRMEQEGLAGGLAYWRQQLAGIPERLELPTDRTRPPVQSFGADLCRMKAGNELAVGLKRLSQSQQATLYMSLLAAFAVLLSRYSGQEEIVVGTPIANRQEVELEDLIGFFVNTLAMRVQVNEDKSVGELVAEARRVALEAYQHQDVPFERVVEELSPERSLNTTPIFQVLFALQNAPWAPERIKGLEVELVVGDELRVRFDLEVHVWESEDQIELSWLYNRDLFDRWRMEQMARHYLRVLEAMIADARQQICSIELLTAQERRQILYEWNRTTKREFRNDLCLHFLFEEQCERNPDSVAVVFEQERLTYRKINARANQLAHYLRGLGVSPDVKVGISLNRSIELVVGLLGILKAGGAYVPIDPDYPAARIAFMIEDAGVKALVTRKYLRDAIPAHHVQTVCLDEDWSEIAGESEENPAREGGAENLAYVIYTSGSTGTPKGAMNEHRGIFNYLRWRQLAYPIGKDDRIMQKTPFSFDVSVWEFFLPLISGSCIVLARPGAHRDSNYLIKLIVEQGITMMHFVPSQLQILLNEESLEECVSLKRVICSGEAMPPDLKNRFYALSKADLINLYGPTEAAVDVTFWDCVREDDRQLIPIGHPITNTQIYILDAKFQPVPIGSPGELCIGGLSLARGYLNQPHLTAEKFIPNPFGLEMGDRLYRTGDLAGYLGDGSIEYLGRIDNQVKIRGCRIELGEIERALCSHPDISESVVVARDDLPGGRGLIAYTVISEGHELSTNEMRDYLWNRLPEYMIPAAFIKLQKMPLTSHGKLDRRALPALDQEELRGDSLYQKPRTQTEKILTEIWQQVLNVEKIGINDNFFDLGGHSLLANQIVSRIRAIFQIVFPLRRLFRAPTIAKLAIAVLQAQIEQSVDEETSKLLAELGELSEDEAQALISGRTESPHVAKEWA
jgi:amino acid adenylation domain-containing protein